MERMLLLLITLMFSFKVIASNSSDWMMNYYKSPTPQKFVEEVQAMSKSKIINDPHKRENTAVFLSRVLEQNPEKSNEWFQSLSGLNKAGKELIVYAAWLANTQESKAYLTSIGLIHLTKKHPPNYLDSEISYVNTLDILWSYFFATGSRKPIERIITALNYADWLGSIDAYKASEKTEEDKQKVRLELVFRAAIWSLESNAKKHPKVAKVCYDMMKDPNATENERKWLAQILSKVHSHKVEVDLSEEKAARVTH